MMQAATDEDDLVHHRPEWSGNLQTAAVNIIPRVSMRWRYPPPEPKSPPKEETDERYVPVYRQNEASRVVRRTIDLDDDEAFYSTTCPESY